MTAKRRYRVQPGTPRRVLASVCLGLLLCLAHASWGSVALLLEQPYGGLSVVNPTGHSAIYLDHVCAATPLQLRACYPGEMGVVISRYDGIDNHDWIAIPLIPYLYSVDSLAEVPSSADRATEQRLRDAYRRIHLEPLAPDAAGGGAPEGNWYELVGSAFDRTIYGFQVNTTPAQDAKLIAELNDRGNTERYNGAFRNCADFARVILNRFYPHAVRRNFIADFGISTPKSVARGLTHYSHKHPGSHLQVFVIPQVKGELPRSHGVQGVAESLLRKYGLPLVVLSPTTTAVILAAYVEHGRFDMPRDAPELDLAALAARSEKGASAAEPSVLPVTPADTPSAAGEDSELIAPIGSKAQLGTPAILDFENFEDTGIVTSFEGERLSLPVLP